MVVTPSPLKEGEGGEPSPGPKTWTPRGIWKGRRRRQFYATRLVSPSCLLCLSGRIGLSAGTLRYQSDFSPIARKTGAATVAPQWQPCGL